MWDTVIVGGGSAGCALAARLSADPTRRVLLLEAGPSDFHLYFKIPIAYFRTVGNPRFDWMIDTEPEPTMHNRRLRWPRGKVLGGSSAINGLIANRGHPTDYDAWRAQGCIGWGWADVFPYFRRLERYESDHNPDYHSKDGPLPISEIRGFHPVCTAFKAACAELGIPANPDFNGPQQDGCGYYQVNIWNGSRVTSAGAYLPRRSVRHRPNLKILTHAVARRVLFKGRRAVGVEYLHDGAITRVEAERQVILAAGAIFSPHLLEVSGVGDGARLQKLGIAVVHHAPAVGTNLQDHLQVRTVYRSTVPTFNDVYASFYRRTLVQLRSLFLRYGPTWGVSQFGIFARTNPLLDRPDVQFHIHPASGSFAGLHPFSGFTLSTCQLRPESRGYIETVSPDPSVRPAVHANYLATETDCLTQIAGIRLARKLGATEAVKPFIVDEYEPGAARQSDDDLIDYARATGVTTYHPVGTCRMGGDDDAVVDPRLRVKGVSGLYVVDASIMPTLIAGNTHVPTVMIAEKASDMIIADERVVDTVAPPVVVSEPVLVSAARAT